MVTLDTLTRQQLACAETFSDVLAILRDAARHQETLAKEAKERGFWARFIKRLIDARELAAFWNA
jgi:hypothetical protein